MCVGNNANLTTAKIEINEGQQIIKYVETTTRRRKVFPLGLLLQADEVRFIIDIIDVVYPHAHVAVTEHKTIILEWQDSICWHFHMMVG